jgi:DNA mismatch endonuclease (patch repair protein)
MAVRKTLHALGYRYRLHDRRLPGTPDIVFAARRKVVFVHGCFWHRHDCNLGRKQPSVNREYWLPKFARNQSRDARDRAALQAAGWQSLVVWECETQNAEGLIPSLVAFLGAPKARSY